METSKVCATFVLCFHMNFASRAVLTLPLHLALIVLPPSQTLRMNLTSFPFPLPTFCNVHKNWQGVRQGSFNHAAYIESCLRQERSTGGYNKPVSPPPVMLHLLYKGHLARRIELEGWRSTHALCSVMR